MPWIGSEGLESRPVIPTLNRKIPAKCLELASEVFAGAGALVVCLGATSA